MRTPLYTEHFARSPRVSTIEGSRNEDTSLYRTLHQVPKVSTIEGSRNEDTSLYRTLHQVPKVSTIIEQGSTEFSVSYRGRHPSELASQTTQPHPRK